MKQVPVLPPTPTHPLNNAENDEMNFTAIHLKWNFFFKSEFLSIPVDIFFQTIELNVSSTAGVINMYAKGV